MEEAPSRKLHMHLIAELAKRYNYSDVSLRGGLVMGIPIYGDIPRINAIPSKVTSATMALGEVRDSIRVKMRK